MDNLISFLQVVSLLICIFGFSSTLQSRFDVRIQYSGICAISLISVAMILMGILNMLLAGTIILYTSGICLFFVSLFKKNIKIKHIYYYLLSSAIIFIFTYKFLNVEVSSYDAFSHWGLVIRLMQSKDMIPRFDDWVIGFSDYPVGLSIFSYFGSIIIKFKENLYVQSYAVVYVFSMMSLLPFDEDEYKNNTFRVLVNTAVVFFLVFYINTINVPLTTLYVDNILATVSAALVLMVYTYRCNIEKIALPFALMSSFLINIKHSGVYFVILGSMLYLAYSIKGKKANKNFFLSLISSYIFKIIWERHYKYAFYDMSGAKHSVSISKYIEEFTEKGDHNISIIANKFLHANILDRYWHILLGILIISIICVTITKKREYKSFSKFMILTTLSVLIYQILNFGMYIFSMPLKEAITLAGYDRYFLTIKIFSVLIISGYILENIFSFSKPIKIISILAFISIVGIKSDIVLNIFTKTNINTMNNHLYSIKKEAIKNFKEIDFYAPSKNYRKKFMIFDDHGYNYEGFMIYKYILLNSDIQMRGIDDYGKVDTKGFDIILVNSKHHAKQYDHK